MVDEDTKKTDQTTDDQSYEFPSEANEEFGSGPHSGGTEHIMSVLKNTKLMYALGGIVGLYLLMSLFSSSDDDSIQPIEAPPVAESAQPEADTADSAKPAPSFSSFEDMLVKSNDSDEEFEKLKKSVSSLNRQYADYRSRLQELDKKVDDLTVTLNRTSTQLSKLIDKDLANANVKKEVVLQEYRIRAVISGRAWLEDKSGNNITIKVGDKLPTYGRVTEIKPVEGIVNTSSGRVISFDTAQ